MSSVWYVAGSGRRVLTVEDWALLGIEATANVEWNLDNGWSVPESALSQEQIDALDTIDGFLVGQADGPREYPFPPPGSGAGSAIYYREMRKLYRQAKTLMGGAPAVGSYTYDSNGNVTGTPDGSTYTWESDGAGGYRVHTQTVSGTTRTFNYNPDGTIASIA